MESKIELKPCPFCGGEASMQDWTRGHKPGELALDDTWGICCESEGCPCNPATGDGYRSPEAAAEAWNRRANESEVVNGNDEDIVAEMRLCDKEGVLPGPRTVGQLAARIEAACRREAESIERIVRDAIIDYQEMYAHAPNDDAERDLKDREKRGNSWLAAHGYDPEKITWSKEEAPCL